MDTLIWKLKWFIATHLPKWVVEFAILRAVTFATSGKYSSTILPELSVIELSKRWSAQ